MTYPWPRATRYKGGRKVSADDFCEPLFQLNLADLPKVPGLDLEDGLVQVWMDNQDSVVRFIPRSEVSSDFLTSISDEIFKAGEVLDPDSVNVYNNSAHKLRTASWLHSGYSLAAIGEAQHSPHGDILYDMEQRWLDLEMAPESLSADVDQIYEAMCKFDFMAGSTLAETYLFGNFYPIQYEAFEFEENGLFVLTGFSSGKIISLNGGSGQLCIDPAKGVRSAFFSWSC